MTDRYKPPSQKVSTPVILVDPETGEAYTTASPLPVSSEPPVGGATEAKQEAQTALLTTIAGAVKAEDSLHVSGDGGIPALGVRANTPTLLATEGDYAPFLIDAAGALWVAGSQIEDLAHASGDRGHFVLAVRNDAGTALAGTDGDYIGLTTDAQGRLWIAGTQTEDAAHTSGDRGVMALGVRKDTAAALAGSDGDYHPFIVSSTGRLYVDAAISSNPKDVTVSLTRTADTNVYAANDVVGAATGSTAALTFSSVGDSGASIRIIGAELLIEATGLISGEIGYRLALYSVTPPSALGDNAAFDVPSGDRASFLGYIDLGTPIDLGSTLYIQSEQAKDVKLASADLFAYLVTLGTYTPTSARVYKITLHTAQK